jgi:5,10-methylene-tetrahydrofolate dehydrogenase/methenyl tetrahydrofolate cyclohydrolase
LEKNIRKFTDVPEDEQLKQKISELELKKKTEKEDLLIAISYQKDLDGIKEVFEKMGLNF